MDVPTLSKKQIKSTLLMKKSKKEVIKNVLSSPYNNTFWPEVSVEDEQKIKVILEKHLPQIKSKKINIPWKEIKNIPKSERKKFRLEFGDRMNVDRPNNSEKQGLILGINDVTKGLEQDSVNTVLISSDVQPRLMVQHVIDLAVLKGIPLLIVTNLRKITKQRCGISSVILGIEKNTAERHLVVIKNCVQKLFKKVPPPTDHVNFGRSNITNSETKECEEEEEEEKSGTLEKKCDEDNLTALNWEEIMSSVYLKKKGHNRVFIPQPREKESESEVLFMEITDSTVAPKKSIKRKFVKYKSLKVKRLKGDPERTKKKIRKLKKS